VYTEITDSCSICQVLLTGVVARLVCKIGPPGSGRRAVGALNDTSVDVGTVPDLFGLVWPNFRPKSCSNLKISGRILQSFRGPSRCAEQRLHRMSKLLFAA
jgi:hypothetical protein